MKITDLTSDGNHSVIVAGRDGAGRLGQESEELTFYFRGKLYHYVIKLTGHDCFVLQVMHLYFDLHMQYSYNKHCFPGKLYWGFLLSYFFTGHHNWYFQCCT